MAITNNHGYGMATVGGGHYAVRICRIQLPQNLAHISQFFL